MRRMITDKELSFFDAYAQSGAIGKYSNISVSTKSISEWNGVKIAYGYMKGSTFPYDLTIDFNGAKDLALRISQSRMQISRIFFQDLVQLRLAQLGLRM